MVSKKFTLSNQSGLHVRPAGVLVKAITPFASNITLTANGRDANAKSLMAILACGIKVGTEIEVKCDGPDEEEAMAKVTELVESGFGE